MPRLHITLSVPTVLVELRDFRKFLWRYIRQRGYRWFSKFEVLKDVVVDLLYRQRGKYARPFLHFGTIALVFFVVTFGPFLLQQAEEENQPAQTPGGVLSMGSSLGVGFSTVQAEEVRQYRGGEITTHVVKEGETLSEIATRYGLDVSTIIWENNIDEKTKLKPGQELRILPIDGVRHKVQRGETIFSISKKYTPKAEQGVEEESRVQRIVDYPFNEFLNDETFELATGQFVMVPEGVKPADPISSSIASRGKTGPRTIDAGPVSATGTFIRPASGILTQGYFFYHRAWDIANRAGGPILASDAGTVMVAGWPDNSGYGNRVVIDHNNGYTTLYAHMSVIQVQAGQRVNRGDVLGQMGSTGRSTGTHLHFEIRQGGVQIDPGSKL